MNQMASISEQGEMIIFAFLDISAQWPRFSNKQSFSILHGLNTGSCVTRFNVSKVLRFKNFFQMLQPFLSKMAEIFEKA